MRTSEEDTMSNFKPGDVVRVRGDKCIVCGEIATERCAELAHRALASTIQPTMKPHCHEHGVSRFFDDSKRVNWAARCAVARSDMLRVLKACGIEPNFRNGT